MACSWLEVVFNLKVEKAEIENDMGSKDNHWDWKKKTYGRRNYMINNW